MSYAIKQAFKQFFRNGAMSAASLFSISAILLILGFFFLLAVNVSNLAESVKKDFDTIQLHLLDSAEYARSESMMKKLKLMPEVSEVRYLTKDQAMEDFKKLFGDKAYLLEMRQENPLPNSIIVKVRRIEDVDAVVARAKSFDGIEVIKYYKEAVNRLIRFTRFIQAGAMALILFLVVISIVVVSNTIKLTVVARDREIAIMKYVGATNWFIRGPFLVEGILMGVISAAISAGIVALVYARVIDLFGTDLAVMLSTSFVPLDFMIGNLAVIFAALGAGIGACGSIISMRRFLDT
ncbi:MAG: permease-like cell division protein FtsX [Clostridiales Family XIII bacterium]|jgi:cell division transport system permease protein|nr:permease-like cell division protein FtsX [Clostridiales Family XIII bacterium]